MSVRMRIRLWRDEFDRLPEYSSSKPTGTCHGKAWRYYCEDGWLVGCYAIIGGTLYTFWWYPVFLSGPRRGDEPMRLKTRCTHGELLSMFPDHIGRDGAIYPITGRSF